MGVGTAEDQPEQILVTCAHSQSALAMNWLSTMPPLHAHQLACDVYRACGVDARRSRPALMSLNDPFDAARLAADLPLAATASCQ